LKMDANDSNIRFANFLNETLEELLLEKDPLNRRRATDVTVRFRAYLNDKRLDSDFELDTVLFKEARITNKKCL